MKKWLLKRLTKKFLGQASTIRGVVLAGGLVGFSYGPEQIESILTLVGSLLACIEVFKDDKNVG